MVCIHKNLSALAALLFLPGRTYSSYRHPNASPLKSQTPSWALGRKSKMPGPQKCCCSQPYAIVYRISYVIAASVWLLCDVVS